MVAYTRGPGLAGALLVGAGVACALGAALGGRCWACTTWKAICCRRSCRPIRREFPFIALLVSGGHTQLMRVDGVGRYQLLGETIDDAAGEAFDKSAKLMGLGYPGGPALARLAEFGDAEAFDLPRPLLHSGNLDFSFAGLKTAVLTQVRSSARRARARPGRPRGGHAAAIVEVLVKKSLRALKQAASRARRGRRRRRERRLRAQLSGMPSARSRVHYPELALCTDNGAMIALAAAMRLQRGIEQRRADYAFDVKPRWPLATADASAAQLMLI